MSHIVLRSTNVDIPSSIMQNDRTNTKNNDNDIYPHENDVLSGRGVSIANNPGNKRFRTLVTTYIDESYCFSFTSSEKKAIALDIVNHISKLDPPGRFLKRTTSKPKGLEGPWFVMNEREIIKKTCQALRDCNRLDRSGYAMGVKEPEDVKHLKAQTKKEGLTVKDRARAAVEKNNVKSRDRTTLPKANTNGTICRGGEFGRGKVLMKREDIEEGERSLPSHTTNASSNPYPTRYATASRIERTHEAMRNVSSPSYKSTTIEEKHQNNHHRHDYYPYANAPRPSSSVHFGNGHQLPYDSHYHHPSSYFGHSHSHGSHGESHALYASHFSPLRSSRNSSITLHPAANMSAAESNINDAIDYSIDYYYSSDPLPPTKKQRTEYQVTHSSTIVSKSTSTSSPPTPTVNTDSKNEYNELEDQFIPESSSTHYNDLDDDYLLTNVMMDFDSHELTDALNLLK